MAVGELSDDALITTLRSDPELRKRVSSIVLAVEGDEGEFEEADAAEERMVEEMCSLRRKGCASRGLSGGSRRRSGEICQRPRM